MPKGAGSFCLSTLPCSVMSAAPTGCHVFQGGDGGERKRPHKETSIYISLAVSIFMAIPTDGSRDIESLTIIVSMAEAGVRSDQMIEWVPLPRG